MLGIVSYTSMRYSIAFSGAEWQRSTKAFLLHVESASAARKVSMMSGASEIMFSWFW